jgi:serine O-acetyltransferase
MKDSLNGHLDKLTAKLIASYDSDARTQRIAQRFLPSREKIVQVLEEIRALLFPGYFGQRDMTKENAKYYIGAALVCVGTELSEQVFHCLCYDEKGDSEPCSDSATEITTNFLARIPAIREMLALDAQAAYDGDPAAKNIDEIVYCYPGFYAVTVYRIAHELLTLGVPLMPRIMTEHAHSVTGCDIHPGAMIGKSFFIDHATGVVIGETSSIGDNVKIYQGVTLGALSFPKDERGRAIKGLKRHPTIEDNVTIYANATILGGQTVIGKGVTVSGNTFVTESVSADSLVMHETPKLTVRSKRKK